MGPWKNRFEAGCYIIGFFLAVVGIMAVIGNNLFHIELLVWIGVPLFAVGLVFVIIGLLLRRLYPEKS